MAWLVGAATELRRGVSPSVLEPIKCCGGGCGDCNPCGHQSRGAMFPAMALLFAEAAATAAAPHYGTGKGPGSRPTAKPAAAELMGWVATAPMGGSAVASASESPSSGTCNPEPGATREGHRLPNWLLGAEGVADAGTGWGPTMSGPAALRIRAGEALAARDQGGGA
eukprot:CAMPEP_0180536016 /NCGR_PEP_ID=MMETSP1036_2-20121128/65047_1 /TAXON_ID=632150 /ORGANISM="Azadinium spinosum, Strain 3D9" /LENGTH=166 /DNA_ID=CAMNT_0022550495 /DNA_START=67 /DNA_END=567 /DNA_ORIENTATION=-